MTAEAAALTLEYSVGRAYRVTFSCSKPARGSVLYLVCEWEPSVPSRLTGPELRAYRRARNAFAAELASMAGGGAAVLEVANACELDGAATENAT